MGFDKKLSKQRCAGETEDLAVTNRYCPDSTCTVIYLSSKSSRKIGARKTALSLLS